MEALASRNLRFSDCVCPVCLSVLIEPVTMPCDHELCMPCFKQNVEGANFTCPLCRKRISTWVRRATRTNSLVNIKRWCQIQKAFPDKVQRRLQGTEDNQSSDEEFITTPPLSEPGAIRDEYMKEVLRVNKEQEHVQQMEEDASRNLIQQLTEEEDEKERERRRIEMEDEAYAHNLSSDFAQEKPIASPGFNKMLCGAFKGGTSGCLSKQSSAANLLLDQYLVKTPKHQELLASPSSSRHADDTSCFFFGNSRASSQLSELNKEEHLPSLPFVDIKDESSDSSALVISPYEPSWPVASSHDSSSIDGVLTDDQSTRSSLSSAKHGFNRSASAASTDSISPELVHFKPIHSSPCTPPRTLPNGKLATKPPLVRTVPYNLSSHIKEQNNNAPEIPLCSPIMRKRLSELAGERDRQVKALSKSTCTSEQNLPSISEMRSPSSNAKSDSAVGSEVSPSHQTFPPDSGFESDESLTKSVNKRNFQPLKSTPKPLRSKGKGVNKSAKQSAEAERSSSALNSTSSNLITWLKLQQSSDQDSVPAKRSQSCMDSNQNCVQSEDDYLLALKLQAEFDLEAKYRLTAIRSKEVDGEYSLRKKRQRVA